MGAIQINHIQIQGYGLEDLNNSLQPLTQQSLAAGQLSALSGGCLETLNEAWKNWVHQHLQGGETP
jgi:hypothetical protein